MRKRHKVGRSLIRHRVASLENDPDVIEASMGWLRNRVYVDNAGNYRIKGERGVGAKVAPWNRKVKRKLASVGMELHGVAHRLFAPNRERTDFERMHALPLGEEDWSRR